MYRNLALAVSLCGQVNAMAFPSTLELCRIRKWRTTYMYGDYNKRMAIKYMYGDPNLPEEE